MDRLELSARAFLHQFRQRRHGARRDVLIEERPVGAIEANEDYPPSVCCRHGTRRRCQGGEIAWRRTEVEAADSTRRESGRARMTALEIAIAERRLM